MTPTEPVPERVRPRDKPIPLLAGLFVGAMTLSLSLILMWPFAWIFPTILGAATYPWARTRQFAIGAFAAAFGAAIAALTEMILLVVWP